MLERDTRGPITHRSCGSTPEYPASGGKFMLAGVSLRLKERLDVTETTRDVFGGEDILLAAENLGEAARVAR